jgi:hypothetical protein
MENLELLNAMKGMMERQVGPLASRMEAERKADREETKPEMKADQEELVSRMDVPQEKMEAAIHSIQSELEENIKH